jgi:thioredoxin
MRTIARSPIFSLYVMVILGLVSCGGDGASVADTSVGGKAEGVLDITSIAQFDAEIAKDRPGAVVVADFHAEWCGPCKKLGPDLVALAAAHPGKLHVLKVDVDQHPVLAERFQAESIPLLVKFAGGKEIAREVGYRGKERLAAWLAIP